MTLIKAVLAAALALPAVVGPAHAKVVIHILQDGGDVVATGSGALDLTDLSQSPYGPGNGPSELEGDDGFARVGAYSTIVIYPGISGPASFGSGARFVASSGSGDAFGVFGSSLHAHLGYISNSPLWGSSTYDGETLASMGLTRGKYVYNWGSGANADSLTVVIGIPEAATWAMMMVGFLGLAGLGAARKTAVFPA